MSQQGDLQPSDWRIAGVIAVGMLMIVWGAM